jgi:RIO kinase 1
MSVIPRIVEALPRMKTPKGLQALIEEGVIDQVLRPLKSGKEASV